MHWTTPTSRWAQSLSLRCSPTDLATVRPQHTLQTKRCEAPKIIEATDPNNNHTIVTETLNV